MDTNITKDNRNSQRICVKFPIRYQMKRGGFFASALTQNISLSGLKLNADRFFPSGLNFNLELNILSKVIRPIGRVVWSQALPHSDQYQMGIKFIEVNSNDKNYLSDYINMRTTDFTGMEK
ncbi:MAG: PilZ domain-containing protein [Candidatus Omnitrophota bacterium]